MEAYLFLGLSPCFELVHFLGLLLSRASCCMLTQNCSQYRLRKVWTDVRLVGAPTLSPSPAFATTAPLCFRSATGSFHPPTVVSDLHGPSLLVHFRHGEQTAEERKLLVIWNNGQDRLFPVVLVFVYSIKRVWVRLVSSCVFFAFRSVIRISGGTIAMRN